jgi:hypothetical protein
MRAQLDYPFAGCDGHAAGGCYTCASSLKIQFPPAVLSGFYPAVFILSAAILDMFQDLHQQEPSSSSSCCRLRSSA